MTYPGFTVLLPVHRPPALLPFAIDSVLSQERQDFELFVICDGAPPETADVARRYAAKDPRIRLFEHAKGERHGEAYRHQALQHARGAFVCQLGDDDLWLPNHLGEMARLLEQVDFGNLPQVEVTSDGELELLAGDLAAAEARNKMVTQTWNFFGPTVAGYRLKVYQGLPIGWSPAPVDLPTDLFMWRKFLAREDLRFGTRVALTSLKFSARHRSGWSLRQRRAEIASWVARVSDPAGRAAVAQQALRRLSQSAFTLQQRVDSLSAIAKDSAEQRGRMERELRRLRIAVDESARRLDKLARKVQKMRRSWSWRATRPLRKLARRIGRGEKPASDLDLRS